MKAKETKPTMENTLNENFVHFIEPKLDGRLKTSAAS